jgi:hypothetical protein
VIFQIFHEGEMEMKQVNKVLLTVSAALMLNLIGCEKAEEVRTVEWYREHKAERQEQIKKCSNNPGQLAATPNCMNAGQAESLESIKGGLPKGW